MATIFRGALFSTPRKDPRWQQSEPQNGPLNNLLLTTLKSKDAFFAGAGNGPDYDYPTPPARRHELIHKTWTQSVNLNILSKDKFFTVAGDGPCYDYPNPTPRRHEILQKTWTQSVNLNILSKDQFFTVAGDGPAYDWPLAPANRQQSAATYVQSANLSLLTVPPNPFKLTDWPTPAARFKSVDLLTSTLALNLNLTSHGKPFNESDWPTPVNRAERVDLRTWLDRLKLNLQGKDQFFGAAGQPLTYHYPLTISRQSVEDLRTWLYHLPPSVLAPLISRPFQTPDLTTPAARRFAIELKTWVESINLNLLGKDKFFGPAGMPPHNLEWNLVKERLRAGEWILSSFPPNVPNLTGNTEQFCIGIENRTLTIRADDRSLEINSEPRRYRIKPPREC